MAKTASQGILVEKGEKIGLAVAAGIGVLFLALGVMAIAGRDQDPEAFAKSLDSKAADIKRKMDASEAQIEPVKDTITGKSTTTPAPLIPDTVAYFDPTQPPDWRRIAPVVLPVVEGTVDIAAVKIYANDIRFFKDESGEVKVQVGVLTAKDDKPVEGGGKFIDEMRKKFGSRIAPKRKPPAGGGFPGAPGGPGGGFPGGPGGPGSPGGGFPGGPGGPGGGFPGGPGGPGGGFPGGPGGPGGGGSADGPGTGYGGGRGGMPGMPGMPGGPGDMFGGDRRAGDRMSVQYIEGANDEEIEKQLNGRRLAVTIRPQKMAILQASFPYRAQLEKWWVALRYKNLTELYQHHEDMPVFHGVDVQRQEYQQRGKELELIQDWTSVDLITESQEIMATKLYYNEEPADLKRVMLHEDHLLVMPLPHEYPGSGKYPDHSKLTTIKDSIEKMKKADPKGTAQQPPKSKFLGDNNPFKRDSGASSNFYNFGDRDGMMPGFPGFGKGKGSDPSTPGTSSTTSMEPPEHIYVRVYDPNIQDGRVYAYRLRVKLKNPNFNKKDLVSKQSDADTEELPPLEDHWYEFKQKVKVPQSGYHYVVEYTKPEPRTAFPLPQPNPQKGQAVVQFQVWYDQLNLTESLKEPIGDWVVTEILATRGMYVGGKAFTPVPFWSSVDNSFVLRDIPGEKPPKGKDPRKGAVIEPIRPKSLLAVDVDGGKMRVPVQPNPGERTNRGTTVEDEAATEVLFLYPDGTLDLRSSAVDRGNADRKEREERFKKWVKDTEEKNPGAPTPPKKDDFR